jgi:hypothetical protein
MRFVLMIYTHLIPLHLNGKSKIILLITTTNKAQMQELAIQ